MSTADFARRWWSGQLRGGAVLDVALAPAEAAFRLGAHVRNVAYERGLLRRERAELPVISVGNIAVGGSGKTPFANWLARRLRARGEDPAIAHGGYAADEPELHRMWSADIPVIVDRDRVRAARTARAAGASVLVLDDAFQHRRLQRDLDIVLVAAERWTGRPRLLPRGPWREPPAALQRAQLLVCTRKTTDAARAREVATQLAELSGRPVARAHLRPRGWLHAGQAAPAPRGPSLLVAGVADPELFAESAHGAGASVSASVMYADHHVYTANDARHITDAAGGRPIVTTEKDWVKLRSWLDHDAVWVLRLEMAIDEGIAHIDRALNRVLR